MSSIAATDSITDGIVTVYFPKELESQAQCVCDLITTQLERIQAETGFEPAWDRVNVYLGRATTFDRALIPLFMEVNNEYGVVLQVGYGDESCQQVILSNFGFPDTFMHELVELSLSRPGTNLPVPTDESWIDSSGILQEKRYYTRWFREGFSEYASIIAHRETVARLDFDSPRYPLAILQDGLKRHPFSALDRVGKDLFAWRQSTPEPSLEPNPNLPHVGNTSIDYYAAALGLFLVIEDRFGQDAIREIIRGVSQMERVDGADLVALANDALGTDIRELADRFRYPRTGLYMDAFYPGGVGLRLGFRGQGLHVRVVDPDSAGFRAGLRRDDVVVSIEGKRTVTNFDFELALFEHMHQESVTIGAWRQGVGEIAVEMALQE